MKKKVFGSSKSSSSQGETRPSISSHLESLKENQFSFENYLNTNNPFFFTQREVSKILFPISITLLRIVNCIYFPQEQITTVNASRENENKNKNKNQSVSSSIFLTVTVLFISESNTSGNAVDILLMDRCSSTVAI